MKHSRFYTSLPRVGRVRSNSASRSLYTSSNLPSFFDSAPPPPNSRPVISTNRLPIEAKGEVEGPSQSHHGPLALTAPHATASSPSSAQFSLFFPYPLFVTPPLPASSTATAGTHPSTRRHRPRFQLDVGAYGIPKRCRPAPTLSRRCYHTDAPLAVQVGEDAYFIRDNAMGVADGVGGWARVKPPCELLLLFLGKRVRSWRPLVRLYKLFHSGCMSPRFFSIPGVAPLFPVITHATCSGPQ